MSRSKKKCWSESFGIHGSKIRLKEGHRLATRAMAILGADPTWDQLTPGRIQVLVRTLARQSKQGRVCRTAEYMCDVLYGVAAWLRDEGLIPETAAPPGATGRCA